MARLFVCGDIVNVGNTNSFIGEELAAIIADSDYVIGNLEGPELQYLQPASFPRQFPGTIGYLRQVGFDMMLLANNHITELGGKGLEYTLHTIDSLGVDRIGAGMSWSDAYKPLIKDIEGMSFGFINVCEAQEGFYSNPDQGFGFAWIGYSGLLDDIKSLARNVDYVMVFVHMGLEHYSIPLPEVRDFYHQLCDAGASVVIGGHTHSPQGYEYYGNKFIAYSLGNFFFPNPRADKEGENSSYSLIINLKKGENPEIKVVHHSLKNGIVDFEDNPLNQVDIASLNAYLSSSHYIKMADSMCVKAYEKSIGGLLAESMCSEMDTETISDTLKMFVKKTIFRKKYVKDTALRRRSLLLHLFENESYRYTIIRALKVKNKIQ